MRRELIKRKGKYKEPNSIELMFKNSIVNPETECRIWQRGKFENGYGMASFQGKTWKAHRLIYTFLVGKIPEGLILRHTCHQPACINVDHLVLGKNIDNYNDMVRAGRQKRGSAHPNAKLNEDKVREIRKLQKEKWTYRQLANKFGVCRRTIWTVLKGRKWWSVGDDS